jgi:pimeloyl-ACP methyl ester carboxylesterase
MTTEFCPFGVRAGATRFRGNLTPLLALFIAGFCLVGSSLAQGLPCVNESLPTTDPKHPEQLIQVCIPPVGWNGQLVIYARGFRAPQLPLALPADELAVIGGNATLAALLQSGFAFATTSFRKNGYAIEQGAEDIDQLVRYFKKTFIAHGSLKKTYLVGGSEGGLVATRLIEQFAQAYDGALSLCAPMGGAAYQTKYLGDFRVAFDYFFPSVFRDEFKAFEVPELAYLKWGDATTGYVQDIAAALSLNPSAASQLFNVSRVALNPQDLSGSALQVALSLLFYSIWETPDLVATARGIPYDNRLTFYLGSNNDFALNQGVERVASDANALSYLRHFYQPTGRLRQPLVSLHTVFDPVVPFNHELVYLGLTTLAGHRQNLTILPTTSYGHCNFQPAEVLGAFGLLVTQSNGQLSPHLKSLVSSAPKAME